MTGERARRFDRAFKVVALARMAAGENVSALSRELGVRRKLLYQWRDTVRRGGVEALRGVGRPRAGASVAAAAARPRAPAPPGVAVPDELARAGAEIAALERKIGQQALELGIPETPYTLAFSTRHCQSPFSDSVDRGTRDSIEQAKPAVGAVMSFLTFI